MVEVGSPPMIKVVSLATASDRRRVFAASADTSLQWSFLNAHTSASKDLAVDVVRMRAAAGRELQLSELGCYSSHYCGWIEFLKSDASHLFIFEDDTMVDWPYIEFLATHDFGSMGVHYLKLFVKVPGRFRRLKSPFLDTYHHLIEYLGPAFGCQAYVLSRHGASVLVEKLRRVTLTVDHAMDRSWDHGLPTLALFPAAVFERAIPSSIGDGRLLPDAASKRERMRTKALMRFEQGRRLMLAFSRKPTILSRP